MAELGTCVITGLPLEPGDVIIHGAGETFGVKADVWRAMGRDERQQLREALIPTAPSPAAEPSRKRGTEAADSQQGS